MRQAIPSVTRIPGSNPVNTFEHLDVHYDRVNAALWKVIKGTSTPYFSMPQLEEIRAVQSAVAESSQLPIDGFEPHEIRYLVFASRIPGIFSLGGDLRLFRDAIENRDRASLSSYARRATDAVYHHSTNSRSITTISLVQGTAMGGGFEAALAGNVIIAERGTRLGLPEVLFGLFPGMGAYTLLRRRVSASTAERMILGAENYRAEELAEIGVVDILVEPGDGAAAVESYISTHRAKPGHVAFRRALNRLHPVDHDELYFLADEWVDAAMSLNPIYLRRIDRLIRSQERVSTSIDSNTHSKSVRLPANVISI